MSAQDWNAAGERLAGELLAQWPPTVARKILRLIEARLLRGELDPKAVARADAIGGELWGNEEGRMKNEETGGEFSRHAAECVVTMALRIVRKAERKGE